MTKTGWKSPTIVKQDDRNQLNNGRTCYSFVQLNNIKKNDYSYSYIPLSGGIDLNHASPQIYCNGYNFNIPSNATINKIEVLIICQQYTDSKNGSHRGQQTSRYKTIKLKTGASTTDGGIGKNQIQSTKLLPRKKWTTEENATFSATPINWDVKAINPSIINNSNFGCVIQFTGLYEKAWTTPAIAKVLMNIDYTLPTVIQKTDTTTAQTQNSTTNIDVIVNEDDLKKLDISKPDTPINITIQYKHKGAGGQTPILIVTSNDLLIGDTKIKTFTMPTLNLESTETEKIYTQNLKIYPGTLSGIQTLDIKNNNSYNNITVNGKDKPPINFQVKNSNTETYTNISSSEKEKYTNGSQRIVVMNSKFTGNSANKNGGAMYILTEYFGRSNNTYNDNVAENSPNIKWNGNSIDK